MGGLFESLRREKGEFAYIKYSVYYFFNRVTFFCYIIEIISFSYSLRKRDEEQQCLTVITCKLFLYH